MTEPPQRGKARSWLFGGWTSKNSEDDSTHKNNSSHGHTEKSNKGAKGAHQDDPVQRKKKTATFADMEDDHHHEAEESEVDKHAEDFIDKQKSKLEMERLISMKRYESMLSRGL